MRPALLIAAFIAGLFATFGAWAQEARPRQHIVVGSELDYAPLAFVDEVGRADGFSVDLMKAVCEAMDIDVTFRTGPWSEIRKALETGKIDALPLVAYSAEREQVFDFTEPHVVSFAAIFHHRHHPGAHSLDDLRDKKILVMRADGAHDFLLEKGLSTRLTLTKTVGEALERLARGDHDFALVPRAVGENIVRRQGLDDIIASGPLIDAYRPGFGMAVRKGNAALLAKLNQGLAIVKATGRFDTLYDKWFATPLSTGGLDPRLVRYGVIALVVAAVAALLAVLWTVSLRRQVAERTAELRREVEERQHGERELRRTNRLLAAVIDQAPFGILVGEGSPDDWWITMCNRESERITGSPREQIRRIHFVDGKVAEGSTPVWSMFHTDGTPWPLPDVPLPRAMRGGETRDAEMVVRRPDGTETTILCNAAPIYDDDGEIMAGLVVYPDITPMKTADARLKENEFNFRTLVEGTNTVAWKMDLESGRFVYVSPHAEALLGYPPEAWTGMDFWVEHLHPDDRERTIEARTAETAAGRDHDLDYRMIRPDGTATWMRDVVTVIKDEAGRPTGLTGFLLDIDDRKRVEAERTRTNQLLTAIIEQAPFGIMVGEGTPENWRVTLVNKEAERINGEPVEDQMALGFTDGELVGADKLTWTLYQLDGSRWPIEKAPLPVAMQGEVTRDAEMILRRGDGGETTILCNAAPVFGADGSIIAGLVVFPDITRMKEAEENLRRTVDELVQSNRELERFAFVASHDLQEPLRTIVLFSQILEKRLAALDDDETREHLSYVVEAAKRMRSLVRDLLDYSRVRSSGRSFQTIDMERVVAAVRHTMAETLAGAKATLTVVGPLPAARGDAELVSQLLSNLIANAVKFSRPGVAPEVRVSGETEKDGRTCAYAVADNGLGIEPQYRQDIFAVFKRLHTMDAFPGTGIGLALCRRIIEHHGGRIWVESEPGRGSVFRFTLPAATD